MQNTDYFQETEPSGGFDSGAAANPLSMLCLNNCTACSGSIKRRSPPPSSLSQPNSKKITLHPSFSSAAADQTLQGFTRITLPITSPIIWASPDSNPPLLQSTPTLRRCISDPVYSPGNAKNTASASTLSPENAGSSASANLPPLPPIFGRSVSDPIRKAYQAVITPPDSVNRESPNSKRLMRMEDRMRETSQWWDEFMHDEEKSSGSEDQHKNHIVPTDLEPETENEEAVSVERSGKCLVLHFKCPCAKGHQIILSGKNCYYKLM